MALLFQLFILYRTAPPWARIFKLLSSPSIDSKESIPPAYVAMAGRYNNPIPTRFLWILTPIDRLKVQQGPPSLMQK